MKYSVILLLCLFNTVVVLAQKTQVLDSSLFECHYKCIQKDHDDLYILRYGKNVSQFYSYYNNRDDSLTADPQGETRNIRDLIYAAKHRNDKSVQPKESTICAEYLYYNWPINGKLTMFTGVFFSHCQVEEDIPKIQWNLVADSVKYIIGYKCQLAKTTFRGRDWYAWYTLDIPVGIGPWKFSGLPGLILEVYDNNNFIRLTAVSLAQHGIRPVMFLNYLDEKFQKITREQYLKAMKTVKYPSNTIDANAPYIELN